MKTPATVAKPKGWAIQGGLVAPEWHWAWKDIRHVAALTEGGGDVHDFGPYHLPPGVLIGALTAWETSHYGLVVHTSNVANHLVQFGAQERYMIAGSLSFATVFRPRLLAASDMAFTIEGGVGETEAENALLFLQLRADGDFTYVHEYGAGSNELFTFNTNFVVNEWVKLAVVRDNLANTVKLWLDGVLIGTFNYTNDPTMGAATAATYTWGARSNQSSSGNVDTAVAYLAARAWTDAEVQQWMRDPFGPIRLWTPIRPPAVVEVFEAARQVGQLQPIFEKPEVVAY